MATHAAAAKSEGLDDQGTDRAVGQRLAPKTAHPSPLARCALRSQAPKVGAACPNWARTVLCGGREVTRVPTAILSTHIVRINERRKARCVWQQLMQNSEPLGPNLRTHGTDTGDVAARSVQAGDEAKLDRVAAGAEDDRNCRGAGFGGERGWCSTGTDDDGNAATDQIGRQFRQPLGFIVRPPVFDLYVAALGEADFTQAFAECREHRCAGLGRTRVEISDYRH